MAAVGSSAATPKLVQLVKPASLSRYGNFKRQPMEVLAKRHNLLARPTATSINVGIVGGERSYMLIGSLARLERALLKWTMTELVAKHKFTPVVVPNILYDHIIDRCGFPTQSQRSQVYKISATCDESILDDHDQTRQHSKPQCCIAGTSEMALASIHIGDNINVNDLPKRYCAQSRCYRAETSRSAAESGLYRVHYFNKVEMFAFTEPEKSSGALDEFVAIQRQLFDQLEIHYKVLEMPKSDLGLPAKKKYDIEAFMEGRQMYGEISSASNCTDYQSSRLNIKYSKLLENFDQLDIKTDFVHTVNGTACASTRMLIAIIEQHQTEDGKFHVPKPLVPFMNGDTILPTIEDEKLLQDIKFEEYELNDRVEQVSS